MASPRRPATMENLPCEVLSDIFIRLLAKQLAQMRCVCKPWNALLSESSFIKSHLHRSIHNNDEILLVFDLVFSFNGKQLSIHPSRSPWLELTNFIKLPNNPPSKFTNGMVVGSVNGLISFIYGSYPNLNVYIWNPSLSAVLTLPPCSSPSRDFDDIHYRFGYDPKTDDYKVVKLTSFHRPRDATPFSFVGLLYVVKEWLQVEVYSMRKASWHLITKSPPSHITQIAIDAGEAVLDGNLHWLGYINGEMKEETILTFDLGVETFREIPLPDSMLDYNVYNWNVLGVLFGKLCVMSRVKDGECEVWVMDEYGVAESWVKHHAFSHFSDDIYPYGITLHNEFLFEAPNDRLVLYDPIAGKSKRFKIIGGLYHKLKIIEYVDSLVWVAPVAHDISCCSISQLNF